MTDRSLSHLDPFSGTRMVDVSPKEATHRRALARCRGRDEAGDHREGGQQCHYQG